MILYIEKIHVVKFQQLVMVPLGDIEIHHMALQKKLGEIGFTIQPLILGHPF
jgi:hypothetical protein